MTVRVYSLHYPNPAPPVIEIEREDGKFFGLKIKDRFIDMSVTQRYGVPGGREYARDAASEPTWSLERLMTEEAMEAFTWLIENRKGAVIFPEHEQADYIRIQIADERDSVLFKLYWVNG